MNAKTLLTTAKAKMLPTEISTTECGSDLYLKVTPISTKLVNAYDWKCNVTKFIDNIDHELWYELPFANTDWREARGCYAGKSKFVPNVKNIK